IDFYATLADRQRRMNIRAIGPAPERPSAILREHQELITIIASGDDSAFGPALRTHLDRTHRR
ncbi:MAG: hypothetical protein QOI50_5019, partial [Pseudonocardiales bacterium]|nr:hypothetical protein [Pseudonocardiales bacterium]